MALTASCVCELTRLHSHCSAGARNGFCRLQPCTASRRFRAVCASVATGPEGDDAPDDLTASFAEELQRRSMASAASMEADHATDFDGSALLQVIQEKYDRSYDVTLVRREYMGKSIVAMNIMWAYAEQKSFQLTEEEHLNRLDFIAAALRQWGMVGHVKDTISAAKNRPRVGKAISVMLDVDPSIVNEWFA